MRKMKIALWFLSAFIVSADVFANEPDFVQALDHSLLDAVSIADSSVLKRWVLFRSPDCVTGCAVFRKRLNEVDEKHIRAQAFYEEDNAPLSNPFLLLRTHAGEAEGNSPEAFGFVGIVGEYAMYYKNGQKLGEKYYNAEGKAEGESRLWYPDGTLRAQGRYVDHQKSGEWFYWFDNGNRQSKGGYEAGKRHGKWVFWNKMTRDVFREVEYKPDEYKPNADKEGIKKNYIDMPLFLFSE